MNKYMFEGSVNLTKKHIRLFFLRSYNISILKINTYRIARKKRRVLTTKGYKMNKKRLILSFKQNQSLPNEFYTR